MIYIFLHSPLKCLNSRPTSRDPNFLTDVNVTEIDLSHHYLIDFKLTTEIKTLQQKVVTYRSTKNVDMMKFNEDVQNRLNTLPPTRDLATKVENYNVTLTQIVQEHTCMKTRTMKIVPDAPWFDADYANLRKLRRNAEKSYRRSGSDNDKKLYSLVHIIASFQSDNIQSVVIKCILN